MTGAIGKKAAVLLETTDATHSHLLIPMNRLFSRRRIRRLDEASRRALQVSLQTETNGLAHELSRVQQDYAK